MKGVLLFMVMVVSLVLFSRENANDSPIVGRWKFISQSSSNDFKCVINSIQKYKAQYFIFEKNHEFRHEFTDSTGQVIKSLKGKWKPEGNQVNISYKKINCNHTIDYFFVGNDLILGRNFNTVILSKDNIILKDIAMK